MANSGLMAGAMPETLIPALDELERAFRAARGSGLLAVLPRHAGRLRGPAQPLFLAEGISDELGGARIYLKREDLNHTGAHKINNCLGQILLARRMGKRRIIAETGAGQHGVATATVCALYGLQCVVYMGAQDMARQSVNVRRMRMLGAQVRAVHTGTATLKDAMNEALRDWIANVADTYYLLGTGAGPHPYPWLVREFQRVIGDETREQILADRAPAGCHGRLRRRRFERAGLLLSLPGRRGRADDRRGSGRAGPGQRRSRGQPGAGCPGVLHGCHSYYLQDEDGQIINAHSISAGLDYPGVGPEHALLHDRKRVDYVSVTDAQAVSAFHWLTRRQGILPALESAHALAHARELAPRMRPDDILIVCLSGRGDKDLDTVTQYDEAAHEPA